MTPGTLSSRLSRAMRARKMTPPRTSALLRPSHDLVVTFELVPARASRGKAIDQIMAFVKAASKERLLSALSITDNAGGHPALSPTALGHEIKAMGLEPIIHFSCKDKNRNLTESLLFELDRRGFHNLLVLTGDFPRFGFMGAGKPVFDIDSVHLLGLITQMNQGFMVNPMAPGGGRTLPPARFFPGCVVSPFKSMAQEQIPQYIKLKKKIRSGARFVITQLGYDVRRYHELRLFMDQEGLEIPLLGTIFVPTLKMARILHKKLIPGCTFPTRLLEDMESKCTSPEKAHSYRLELGAKLTAVLRGLGYQGVHLSGPELEYQDIVWILKRAEELFANWMDIVKELTFPEEWQFHYFEMDPETGLNQPRRVLPEIHGPGILNILDMQINRFVHNLLFEPGKGLYAPAKAFAERIKGSGFEGFFTAFEYWAKGILYDCRECGDCTLEESAYLCPQSRCAKFLLNGPCGGSSDGYCEVWPGKRRCFYVDVFQRLTYLGKPEILEEMSLPPKDWRLYRTSSWLNFYLGLDHRASKK